MPRITARGLALALLAALPGCYQSHGPFRSTGGDGSRIDAGPSRGGPVDVGAIDGPGGPLDGVTCDLPAQVCGGWDTPRFLGPSEGGALGHDVAWAGGRLLAVLDVTRGRDGNPESRLVVVEPDETQRESEASFLDGPALAWHPPSGVALAVGRERALWIGPDGTSLGERLLPTGTVAEGPITVAPIPAGFLVLVPRGTGGDRRLDGAVVGTAPDDLRLFPVQTSGFGEREVVVALDDAGFARFVAAALTNPRRRVIFPVTDDGLGPARVRQEIASTGEEPVGALLVDGRLVLMSRPPNVIALEELVGDRLALTRRLERGVGRLPYFSGVREAIAVGDNVVFPADTGTRLIVGTLDVDEDVQSFRQYGARQTTRRDPRITATPRGFAVTYRCGDEVCLLAFDCCPS